MSKSKLGRPAHTPSDKASNGIIAEPSQAFQDLVGRCGDAAVAAPVGLTAATVEDSAA